MNDLNIIVGDCREEMAKLSEQSVQCVVTSPPYWGQRDYGVNGMIGLEADVHEWIDSMVEVFRGVWRVLRDDGTVWLNLGDKYAGSGGASAASQRFRVPDSKSKQASNHGARSTPEVTVDGLKQKDLIGLPWRMAFALQADGWYLRRDIIWHKPNPMPESATDRPSTAHEYVFLLTKQPKYFYDQDAVRAASDSTQKSTPTGWDSSTGEGGHGTIHKQGRSLLPDNASRSKTSEIWDEQGYQKSGERNTHPLGANMRSVWTIPTQPFGGAHYATYPEKLVEPCIKAGSSERGECPACGAPWERVVSAASGGTIGASWHEHKADESTGNDKPTGEQIYKTYQRRHTIGWQPTCDHKREPIPQTVLDPFSGAGTTGLVAMRLGRSYTGIELNPEYAAMSRKRIVERVGATSPDALKPDEQAQGRLI